MKNITTRFIPGFLLALLMVTFVSLTVSAGKAGKGEIRFDTTTHDFGNIPEKGGLVTCEFEFTNIGDGNLAITNVVAQCGCTRPQYSNAPVKMGKSGKIKVSFNPLGRPGGFLKTITVHLYNCNKKKVTLKIKGNVIPDAKKK